MEGNDLTFDKKCNRTNITETFLPQNEPHSAIHSFSGLLKQLGQKFTQKNVSTDFSRRVKWAKFCQKLFWTSKWGLLTEMSVFFVNFQQKCFKAPENSFCNAKQCSAVFFFCLTCFIKYSFQSNLSFSDIAISPYNGCFRWFPTKTIQHQCSSFLKFKIVFHWPISHSFEKIFPFQKILSFLMQSLFRPVWVILSIFGKTASNTWKPRLAGGSFWGVKLLLVIFDPFHLFEEKSHFRHSWAYFWDVTFCHITVVFGHLLRKFYKTSK